VHSPIRARFARACSYALLGATFLLSPAVSRADVFVDRAAADGIDFVHFNGMSGELYFPEMTGAGAALFDYDRDGDLDVYLLQGSMLGARPASAATFPPSGPLPPLDRLYRNDLEVKPDGTRVLRFTDVTEESGIRSAGYGMGVAVGDYDDDGWPDLYVTNFGPNQMFHNEGDGTFTDVTAATGTDDERWSVPAVFFDYDGDGLLDLFVGNYVDYRIATHVTCTTEAGAPDYCGPRSYQPVADRLFRNRGPSADGPTFEDVTQKAGLQQELGPALGATVSDFNGDGLPDLYVANDGASNQLWLNQGDGTFRDEALLGGCAVNEDGQPEASMGVVAGDFDGDGDDDLFMTHLTQESNTFYLNDGTGLFEDWTRETGLDLVSWKFTGFGIAQVDYDNDGWLDLFIANGAVTLIEEQLRAGDPYALKQKNLLLHHEGVESPKLRFEPVPEDQAGAVFALEEVSRGVAMGDVDNDGDDDLLVSNNSGPARLLINQVGQDAPWLGLRLVDGRGRSDVLGARIGIVRKGFPTLWRRSSASGSYGSAADPRVLVGLGVASRIDAVRVEWPSGLHEEFHDLPLGRYATVREGAGQPVR